MKPVDERFVTTQAAAFEDFWNRRSDAPHLTSTYPAYGYQVRLETNDSQVLEAARLSAPRYCLTAALDASPQIRLKIYVVPSWEAVPVPPDLPASIQTFGAGDHLFQAATPWLQWTTDLVTRTSYGLISRSLAAEPRLVSRFLLDRATLNVLLNEGVGQLHATSLVHDEQVLLFIAAHGTGKSTTAFHLLNVGYKLMGDSLLFVRAHPDRFELMGYPAGEGKLTPEMHSVFPEWSGGGDEVTVHNVHKTIVDLKALAPNKIVDHSIFPNRILVCLAKRSGDAVTRAIPLDPEAALKELLPDTVYWDAPVNMARSLDVIRRLVERADCFQLTLGKDPKELVNIIVNLTRDGG